MIDFILFIKQVKEFESACDIPKVFFDKRVSIRGRITDISDSGHINVKHVPVINLFHFKRKQAGDKGFSNGIRLSNLQAIVTGDVSDYTSI